MFVVSLFDRTSGVPVMAETALNHAELDRIYAEFQDRALRDGYGVIVTEGGGYQLGNYVWNSEPTE